MAAAAARALVCSATERELCALALASSAARVPALHRGAATASRCRDGVGNLGQRATRSRGAVSVSVATNSNAAGDGSGVWAWRESSSNTARAAAAAAVAVLVGMTTTLAFDSHATTSVAIHPTMYVFPQKFNQLPLVRWCHVHGLLKGDREGLVGLFRERTARRSSPVAALRCCLACTPITAKRAPAAFVHHPSKFVCAS